MLAIVALALAALPALTMVAAAPAPYGQDDFDILQYALALENLENQFYASGMAKFPSSSWKDQSQYQTFQLIAAHEASHVDFLTTFLNSQNKSPLKACPAYSFPLNDVGTFVATAKVIENVGVRAYDGAVEYFTVGPAAQAAASIATIEARHASYLNIITDNLPIPSAYDAPTGQRTILSLAASFIQLGATGTTDCLPPKVKPYPSTPFTPATGPAGTVLTVDLSGLANVSSPSCVFISGSLGGNVTVPITVTGNGKSQCAVPNGVIAEAVLLIVGSPTYQYNGLSIAQALASSTTVSNDDDSIVGVGGVFQVPGNFSIGGKSQNASNNSGETMIQGISLGALTFALMSVIAFIGL